MAITTNDIKNITGIYVKENNTLKEIKKGCVIINGQIKYFYGIESIPEYTQIPFIINNKNANGYNETYIDTGITMTSTTRIDFIFSPTRNLRSTEANKRHVIIYIGENYYFEYEYNNSTAQAQGRLIVGESTDRIDEIPKNIKVSCSFNYENSYYRHNFVRNNRSTTYSYTNNNWELAINSSLSNHIYLLGAPAENNIIPIQYPNTKLYECQIYGDYEKTQLLRDFIPVERNSDGKLGLYDLVNNKFYPNAYPNTNIDFIRDDVEESEDDPCKTYNYTCTSDCYTCTGDCYTCTGDCYTCTGDCYTCTGDCYTCTNEGVCTNHTEITEVSISEYHHVNSCPIRSGPGTSYSQIGSTAYNDNLYFSKRTSDYSWYYTPWSPGGWIYSGNLID